MPISKNFLMAGVSGTFDKQVVFRQRMGKTVLSAYPQKSEKPRTEKQLEVMQRMGNANAYATQIIEDVQLRNEAQVRLNVTRNRLYTALVSEFFKKHREIEKNPPMLLPSANEANTQFVTYLLQNTNKTMEEMAALARVPVEFIMNVKNGLENKAT